MNIIYLTSEKISKKIHDSFTKLPETIALKLNLKRIYEWTMLKKLIDWMHERYPGLLSFN